MRVFVSLWMLVLDGQLLSEGAGLVGISMKKAIAVGLPVSPGWDFFFTPQAVLQVGKQRPRKKMQSWSHVVRQAGGTA